MALSQAFLDELRRRLTLSTIIGRTVKLIKAGREFKACCPFHNEKTPSFTINDDKGFYHCFGCGAHGDVITYVMHTANMTFPEAVDKLALEAGLEVPKSSPEQVAQARQAASLIDVVEAACHFFEQQLALPAGRDGMAYLQRRGLDPETIRRFRLGWAPAAGLLKGALVREGVTEQQLVEAGLLKLRDDGSLYDYFRERVIFPITDRRGRVIAFGGRILGDGQPKYLNSPDTPIFQKGTVLYGLAQARQPAGATGRIIVAEGYMDVIALSRAGFAEAVAPLGTALTESQIEELWRLADEPILCFDGDAAGQRAALRAAERALPLLRPGKSLRFAVMSGAKDPDELIQSQGASAMNAVLEHANPLLGVLWDNLQAGRDLSTPERRAALEQDVRDLTGRIAERSVQDHYRQAFKERLWTLFHPPRRSSGSGGWTGGQAGGQSGGRYSKPGFGSRGNRQPDRPSLGRVGVGVGLTRQKTEALHRTILLATLITHPELADSVAERLGELDFTDVEMDRLRQATLTILAQHGGLDFSTLSNHLRTHGVGPQLDALLRSNAFTHAAFSRPQADLQSARDGWEHTFALTRQKDLRADIDRMVNQLGQDPSPETFNALLALKNHQRFGGDD
ncbi:DNA primase [Insolitispirillum peregrinum]|uniref:DNA primase n=1 Tax=Insolitispirillum peregrinum TaxID=80876 RepID=A0A1N7PM37_9PROT|nr:DNA primase [Insolitispirillum peregrinum]SIT11449.1 DNA primase [Insolitispirillum peregrinum]